MLYNVMNGSHYDNPDDVEMVTLDGGISLSVRNDAAFVVDARLSIYEHQSTICPNMPVRSLIYFTVTLSEILNEKNSKSKTGKNIYGKRLVRIPTPHFVVFYNGEEDQPDVQELKLSDAFEKPTDDPKLELKCIVYNINAGKNRQILQKCVWLDEYMMFVNKVREYHSGKSYEELGNDIELAIDYCIDNDILKDFLKTHRSEVTKNMQLNYKFDRQLELERADAREEGLEEGRKLGQKIGQEETLNLINKLNDILLSEGRVEDLKRSINDREYQAQLLKEYRL